MSGALPTGYRCVTTVGSLVISTERATTARQDYVVFLLMHLDHEMVNVPSKLKNTCQVVKPQVASNDTNLGQRQRGGIDRLAPDLQQAPQGLVPQARVGKTRVSDLWRQGRCRR